MATRPQWINPYAQREHPVATALKDISTQILRAQEVKAAMQRREEEKRQAEEREDRIRQENRKYQEQYRQENRKYQKQYRQEGWEHTANVQKENRKIELAINGISGTVEESPLYDSPEDFAKARKQIKELANIIGDKSGENYAKTALTYLGMREEDFNRSKEFGENVTNLQTAIGELGEDFRSKDIDKLIQNAREYQKRVTSSVNQQVRSFKPIVDESLTRLETGKVIKDLINVLDSNPETSTIEGWNKYPSATTLLKSAVNHYKARDYQGAYKMAMQADLEKAKVDYALQLMEERSKKSGTGEIPATAEGIHHELSTKFATEAQSVNKLYETAKKQGVPDPSLVGVVTINPEGTYTSPSDIDRWMKVYQNNFKNIIENGNVQLPESIETSYKEGRWDTVIGYLSNHPNVKVDWENYNDSLFKVNKKARNILDMQLGYIIQQMTETYNYMKNAKNQLLSGYTPLNQNKEKNDNPAPIDQDLINAMNKATGKFTGKNYLNSSTE